MVMNRPTIFIYTNQPDRAVLKEICAGIEEEGIFFEIFERSVREVNELAWQAAQDSMLGSGLGICGMDAAFSMRGLTRKRCVEICLNPGREQCRRLGRNSARAIKRQPLAMD